MRVGGSAGYDVDAATTSLERRGSGIHVVRPGTGGARVMEVRFRGRVLPHNDSAAARGSGSGMVP